MADLSAIGDITINAPTAAAISTVVGILFREVLKGKDRGYDDMRIDRDFARMQFEKLQDTVAVQQQALGLQIGLIKEGMGVVQSSVRSVETLVQKLTEERRGGP